MPLALLPIVADAQTPSLTQAGTYYNYTTGLLNVFNGTNWVTYTVSNPAAITSGTINGTSIGATTPSTGVFTTLSASTPVGVASGGTGAATFTANGLLLGNGTSAVAATAVGANGQLLLGQTSAAPSWQAMSGDATIASGGAVTIAAGAVTGGKIASSTITGSNIAASTIAASNIITGTSGANIPLLSTANTWTLGQTFSGPVNAVALVDSATAPTISAGFCTSPSVVANNGTWAFTINVGSACAVSTGTVGLPAATNGWVCDAHDVTTPASNIVEQSGGTTTTVVLTNYVRTTGVAGNFTSSDVLRVKCTAY
jgi:hypothetical protein